VSAANVPASCPLARHARTRSTHCCLVVDFTRASLRSSEASRKVTQKSILEDVLVLERAARKLRKFVTGISNRTVEMAPAPKEPRPIDEATRERARRALAKSGFVRVTK